MSAPDPAQPPLKRLLAIMQRLRDPHTGCPWDRQQTFASIVPYTIEEAYEVADAIERGDVDDLRDELGDLLFQVVFHAQMAHEQGHFDFDQVAATIADKLVRRHPHVFDAQAADTDAERVRTDWEAHKQRERQARGDTDASALAGIAPGLPEWQRAMKLQRRAARTGFDWPDVAPVLAKLREEIDEVEQAFAQRSLDPDDPAAADHLREELGDVLFVAANLARHADIDVGAALRMANAKFERRFRAMESLAQAEGVAFSSLPLAEQEGYWQRIKSQD